MFIRKVPATMCLHESGTDELISSVRLYAILYYIVVKYFRVDYYHFEYAVYHLAVYSTIEILSLVFQRLL